MWKAILYVTTPLTLVAFLAAVVAWVYVTQLRRITTLISSAREQDRKVLVEGALDVLRVSTQKLAADQRYHLALKLIEGRRFKLGLAFAAFLVVSLLLAALAAFAFYRHDPREALPELLTDEGRSETLAILRRHNIYSLRPDELLDALTVLKRQGVFKLEDQELPVALAKRTQLDPNEMAKLDVVERIERTKARISQTPSIVDLRERAKRLDPPFQPIGLTVTAGVPGIPDDRPRRFYVSVPISSEYAHRRLAVVSPSTGKELRLVARPAIDDQRRDVDIHLNAEQATFLSGGTIPTSSFKILVFVQSPGPLYDPTCPTGNRRFEKDCGKPQNPESQEILGMR